MRAAGIMVTIERSALTESRMERSVVIVRAATMISARNAGATPNGLASCAIFGPGRTKLGTNPISGALGDYRDPPSSLPIRF